MFRKGKICFVSIDVENAVENLESILNIFRKYDVSATLFVTGEILEKYRHKFTEFAKSYEIACHTYTHRFWNTINGGERKKELEDFLKLYESLFQKKPLGFRAPSHIIDKEGIELLEESGFLYDSSVVPHYPPFKKYRGYKGRAPLRPYRPRGRNILEIPVRGQVFGIPLAGAWISKLPHCFYKILFFVYCPKFITLNIHSWDSLKNFEKTMKLLKNKNYQFLNGAEIYKNYQQE